MHAEPWKLYSQNFTGVSLRSNLIQSSKMGVLPLWLQKKGGWEVRQGPFGPPTLCQCPDLESQLVGSHRKMVNSLEFSFMGKMCVCTCGGNF